ncbi:MAG: response regulator [Halarcobacter sp.]
MQNKKRVLIVDDVSANIHFLMDILKEKYIIIAATNGHKALEIIYNKIKPDIILLDIIMPNMDGYEVCKILRDDKNTSHIPIIYITSLEDEKVFKIKADDFISKPFTKDIVLKKVQKYLNKFESKEKENLD